ncbi:MAG: exodeoxyribonuclease VII small subunit [Sediminispirochaetaceae bacterium]
MKKFEERLSELESLNEKMKEGEIPLDEAVSLFERGIKLAKGLEKDLSKIERRIEILVNEPEKPETEEPNLELFTEADTADDNKES